MDSRLLVVSVVTLIVSLFLITNTEATVWTTAGHTALNLNGKMFTLSLYGGGVSFYPPYYYLPWLSTTTRPHKHWTARPTTTPRRATKAPPTTRRGTTTKPWIACCPTTTKPPTTTRPTTTTAPRTTRPTTTKAPTTTRPTTAPSTRGVSVCLRYVTDYLRTSNPSIFTLSPSSTRLTLTAQYPTSYVLTFNGYHSLALTPNLKFLPTTDPGMWTSLCLTVDSRKNVAQVFSGSNMSIRKLLPSTFVWSGEPVIDFPGFDGQLTDVQVWDYPLLYKEVWSYMIKGGFYGSYQGSVLTWSNIAYSPRGNTLMEDTYEWLAKEPIRRRGPGRKRMFRMMEKNNRQLV